MAINGSLDEASLADVLQLLSLGQKTGRLSVSDQSNLGHIYLEEGKITHAFLVNRQHRLGDILFKNGSITQDQLNEAMLVQEKHPDKKVGELLVAIGATTETALKHYMQVQIEEAVYFLFTWRRGDFAFERDVRPDPRDFLVSINPEALLLEGARRVDEWSVIEKKIPSFDMVFTIDAERLESSDVKLSEEQKRIAALLDGVRDVAAIVVETGMIEFEVGQALYGLITAGFAEPLGPRQVQDLDNTKFEISTGHLDQKKLLAYLAHQAEFADPKQRRQSGLHIADCPTCSKKLQEIHIRRSQGLPAIQDELIPEEAEKTRGSAERRGTTDRRQSDAAGWDDQTKDRRTHGAGDRRSDARIAALRGKPPDKERRRPDDRRIAQRRHRERRMGTAVDRSDRAAVERRRGVERRLRERRVVPRRMADVKFQLRGGARKTVPIALDTIAGNITTTQAPTSGGTGNDRRDTLAVRSSATRSSTSTEASEHSQAPPAEQSSRPTRPSVRRMRESPLRGLPLLADGTQWMFVDRSESEADTALMESGTPVSAASKPAAPAESLDDVAATERQVPDLAGRTTEVDTPAPDNGARTTEVKVIAPRFGAGTVEAEAPKQDVTTKARDLKAEDPRREIEQAKSEAAKAKAEAEKTLSEAEKTLSEAAKAKSDAEKAKLAAKKAKAEADRAKSEAEAATKKAEKAAANAEKATTKAESVKSEAVKRKSEAVQSKSEVKKAKGEVERARAEADKAKREAELAKSDAEKARLEADEATTIADSVRLEAEKVRLEAEKAKSEADAARAQAEKTKLEAEQATAKAEVVKSEAVKRKSEAVQTKSEVKKAKEEVERAKAEADKAKREAELAKSDAEKARLEADEATTIADSVRLEAEKVRPDAEKAKLEAEAARAQAEKTKLEAESAKSEAEKAALRALEKRSGRGTPVSLRQLVGGYYPQRISASLRSAPSTARQDAEKAPSNRQSRRMPFVWVGLAAVAVIAMATGWLARPFLSAGSENQSVSADNTQAIAHDAPAVAPVTTADSPLQDSEPVEPVEAPPEERVVPVPSSTPETRPVEALPTRPAEIAAEPAIAQNQPTPAPVQPALEAAVAVPQAAPPPAATPTEPPPEPVEAVSTEIVISGTVREAGTLAPLAGAVISISGSDLSATTDASGVYSMAGLPAGSLTVTAELAGYMTGHELHEAEPGESIDLDLVLRRPPTALQPDDEFDEAEWATTDVAGAEEALGRPVAVVSNLWIESIARPATGTRPRVRVAHLTDSGERITLIVSRSGPANRAALPHVTALRIIPPTEAYPITTGTASFGGLLVTAKATLPADELRAFLQRLVEARGG